MATKKKRGRPRKKIAARKVETTRADTAKPLNDPIAGAEKLADDLKSAVNRMFPESAPAEVKRLTEGQSPISQPEAQPSAGGSPMSQTTSSANDSDTGRDQRGVQQLAETVSRIKDDFREGAYGVGQAPPSRNQNATTGADSGGNSGASYERPPVGPGVVEPPDHDFIPRETVRVILESCFSATGKPLAVDESRALTPLTVDMVNDEGPRLFGDTEHRAFWVWISVMTVFIAARSEAGARLIEWIAGKLLGPKSQPAQQSKANGKAEEKKDSTASEGDSTRPVSPEYSEASGFQVPAKQP